MYRTYTMKDVEKAEAQGRFKAFSFFSGTGGGSLGVRLAGGKVLVANEFVEAARGAYQANSPNTIILPDDVRQIKGIDVLREAGLEVGEVDLVEGSPPCSSFSTAGLREKGWGKEKKYSDTKQRTDDLFFEMIRLLDEIKPRYFILENVKGLTMGAAADLLGSEQMGLFGGHEDTIYYKLTQLGYQVRYKVLNSKHFGVAQSRERLIIVGARNDQPFSHFKFPIPDRHTYIPTLADAFDTLPKPTQAELDECDISKYAIFTESLKLAPGEQSEKYFSLAKQDANRYADTLTQTASCMSAASIVHWNNRKFTRREAIRIQGFPDDVYLGDTYEQAIERLGRSVTPPLYEELLKRLIL